MLYKLLNILFRFSQHFYFKRVEIEGVDRVPFNEANILVANHPSAFKDPILIGSNFTNPIYFLAAEEFMGGRRMSSFLENQFNMIPIFRPTTRPDEVHKNTGSFDKCYEALRSKKSILIFAEGHSETQDWLDPLKSGSARIVLETLAKYPDLKNVNIIPIGLNYSNPHQFRSTFYLKIGELIKVTQNHNYNKSNLTDLAHLNLNEAINGLEKENSYWQIILIKLIKSKSNRGLSEVHELIGQILSKLNENKVLFSVLKKDVESLVSELDTKGESVESFLNFKSVKRINPILTVFYGVLFIPGFLCNVLPVWMIKLFVKKKEFKYSFEGSMYFAFGTLFILVWHLIVVVGCFFVVGWNSLFLPIVMLAFGWLTLKSRDYLLPYYHARMVKKRLSKEENLNAMYSKIENQLDSILSELK